MPLLPGELLQNRYRIVSLLAAGSSGATYRAWDSVDRADAAIKEHLDSSPEAQKLFRAEADRLTRLRHPQLPQFLDHFCLDSGCYLVSRYVDGVDLQSLLDQYGPLPSDLIIGWLQTAVTPLVYLHEKGQLHLGIKPANIRLTPDGDLFLVDSGLPGMGIPAINDGYAAPELAAQTEAAAASDIFSLGAALYTLLTAQIPPDPLRRESGLVDLKPAREVNPNVEPYLSIVANRAMSLRPDARFETAADFADALARPAGHPVVVQNAPRRTPDAAPASRRVPVRARRQMEQRTLKALLVVLIALMALAVMLGIINLNQPETAVTEAEATATLESAVVSALTALAPSPTPLPVPTEPPTPTPEPLVTETGARMLFMPGGLFRMGSDDGETNEKPPHLVRLDAYFIDETEVTNGQYQLCVADGVCNPPLNEGATYHPAYFGDPAFADYPVIFVDWQDANVFCQWRGARLPSEAEWEKAAGFDVTQSLKFRYPWGDAFAGEKANYCDQGCPRDDRDTAVNDGHQDTAPVTSFEDCRSPIGAYNMAGNVMEWVSDWYDGRYYLSSTDTNPLGPPEGTAKVIRGGSWLSDRDEMTVTARTSRDPTVKLATLGFRCAMSPP